MERSSSAVVREGLEHACQACSNGMAELGFLRSRKTLWTRPREHTVDFVHFHRDGISYGASPNHTCSIRIHLGIRVLNDPTAELNLNGPTSSPGYDVHRYHHSFNAKSRSQFDRCVTDLVRFVREIGEPWFLRHAELSVLVGASEVLAEVAQAGLRSSRAGVADSASWARSRRLLGIANG